MSYNDEEPNIIKTGSYTYDIEKVMHTLDNNTCDNETYFNYRVLIDEETAYCIGINSDHELNKFIKSLDEKNLFWCN